MKRELLPYLVCPMCGSSMDLEVAVERDEIEEGTFSCPCGGKYPITRSVPRLLPNPTHKGQDLHSPRWNPKDEHSRGTDASALTEQELQVQQSYGAQWSRLPGVGLDRSGLEESHWEWFRKKMGLESWDKFTEYFAKRRLVLDAGTGRGTKVKRICIANPECTVVGVDFSSSVDEAYKSLRAYPNAHVIQADIRRMPFKKGFFDLVISDGVLHHTPSTQESLMKLSEWVQPGGDLAIHVYRRMNIIRSHTDRALRDYASRLSIERCWEFCRSVAELGRELSHTHVTFNLPCPIPELGIEAGIYDLQRFLHYNFFLCFWDDSMTLDENTWINFDYFHPAYAHRHTEEEVTGWLRVLGFTSVRLLPVSKFGITVRAKAPVRPDPERS